MKGDKKRRGEVGEVEEGEEEDGGQFQNNLGCLSLNPLRRTETQ